VSTEAPGHGDRQEQRREASADRLRRALAELICEQGYSATTNAQIGERAGYSRNMVRDRYGTKDALLLDVFEHALTTLAPDRGGRPGNGRERAVRTVDLIRRLAETEPTTQRALNVVTLEGAAADHPLAGVARAAIDRFYAVVAAAVVEGIADGSVRSDLDVEAELQLLRIRITGSGFVDAARLSARSPAERIAALCRDLDERLRP
jgi:AcrR family transcriptional regulator